ncbi:MAG: type II toxin-antitoxin system VapC family toxin [Sphingomonadales bacterium]|nr:type II toxin-antitoxin system VapC family toxin [Sphingomonadales bacterium]
MPATAYVIDASVLLAAILGELTAEETEVWLAGSCMSSVNLSESIAKLVDHGYTAEVVTDILQAMKLDVRPFDREQAERAGLLRASTRQFGLSLGDRACLALANELQRPAATADGIWAKLDVGIPIELIR